MFNIQGSEMIFLLLVALIILGPEKLPDAIRKFGRAYAEFKKMANGFQGELRDALDEPMRELRDTADMMRNAVDFGDSAAPAAPAVDPTPPQPIKREAGLNFGSANPRRTGPASAADTPAPAEPVREPGLNFGSANPRRAAATPPETAEVPEVSDQPAQTDAEAEQAAAPPLNIRKGPRSVRDPLAGLGDTADTQPATTDLAVPTADAAIEIESEAAE